MGIVMPLFVIMLVHVLGATVAARDFARRRSRERRPDAVGGEGRQEADDRRYDSTRGGRERGPSVRSRAPRLGADALSKTHLTRHRSPGVRFIST